MLYNRMNIVHVGGFLCAVPLGHLVWKARKRMLQNSSSGILTNLKRKFSLSVALGYAFESLVWLFLVKYKWTFQYPVGEHVTSNSLSGMQGL